MFGLGPFRRLGWLAALAAIAGLFPAAALAERPSRAQVRRAQEAKQRQRRQRTAAEIQRQVDAAKHSVAGARADLSEAERNFKAAESAAREIVDQLQRLSESIRRAERDLASQGEKLVAEQPSDSPLGKARSRLRAAETALREARHRVTNSATYQRRYRAAADSPEESKRIDQVQQELLAEDADYTAALDELQQARPEYESLRAKLLAGDGSWAGLSQNLRDLRSARGNLEGQLTGRLLSRNSTEKKYLAAKAALSSAQDAVAEGEQAVARLRGQKNAGKKPANKKR